MGWFQELIQARIVNDEELLREAFADLSSSILGEGAAYRLLRGDKKRSQTAVEEILRFFRAPMPRPPEDMEDLNDRIDYMLRPSGIQKRSVRLTGTWYKDGVNPLLAERDGTLIALLPRWFTGYRYIDFETGATVRITRKNAGEIGREAFCFYRPLPQRKLSNWDLFKYLFSSLYKADLPFYILAVLSITLLGLITPQVYRLIFSSAASSDLNLLLPSLALLLGASISVFFLTGCRNVLGDRRIALIKLNLRAAVMSRLLSLPVSFFKRYSAGELAEKIQVMNIFCDSVAGRGGGLLYLAVTLVISLCYMVQIFDHTPALLFPSLGTSAVIVGWTLWVVKRQGEVNSSLMEKRAVLNGFVFELINGIQKIKLVGGQKRAFAQWAGHYSDTARLTFSLPLELRMNSAMTSFLWLMGTVVLYWAAGGAVLSPAEFMAFTMTLGLFNNGLAELCKAVPVLARIKPALHLISPILETAPEIAGDNKQSITSLSGNIELDCVSFRYEHTPMLLDNLSLKIKRGQYVAVVGQTGSGKSTLLRILLGFEKPLRGSVYYDGKDLAQLDLKSVRRKIGVVMQNGKLLTASIFENIAVSMPRLTMEEAWEAAEIAGIADDIRAMPMGMFTYVGEGGGGFSGGQKQRLLIARAIASKPRILFLDEATSALDNITQKQVADALGSLRSTRVVIAHRLSTIRQCDRIIVLDKGRIAEEGTYDELIELGGVFADLVARQRLDAEM